MMFRERCEMQAHSLDPVSVRRSVKGFAAFEAAGRE
jgi:hypothetical protein